MLMTESPQSRRFLSVTILDRYWWPSFHKIFKIICSRVEDLNDRCNDRCEELSLDCILDCNNDPLCVSQCLREITECSDGKTPITSPCFSYGGVRKIRHFACERDFYVVRSHMYKTYFESFIPSEKIRSDTNKTFWSDLCFIRTKMSYSHDFELFERLNGLKYVLFIWFRNT